MSNDQHSNQSNQHSSENDPLKQLHQFYQSTQPNQPIHANSNQKNSRNSQQQEGENMFQKSLEKMKLWLQNMSALPIMDSILKYHKWLLIGIGIVLFGLIGWIIIANTSEAPEDLIAEFEKAMIEEDKDVLEELIVSDHSQLEIDDVFLNKLIQHGKEDEDFLTGTILLLNAQKDVHTQEQSKVISEILSKSNITKTELLNMGSIYLKQEEGLFGTKYDIAVRPSYIKIEFSTDPTTVKIDGKLIKTKKGSKVHLHGPILPGKYQVQVTKKYPFSDVVVEKDVNLFEGGRTETVTMNLTGETVKFASDVEGTQLFINNRSTQQQVGSDGVEFGPISTNGSLKAHGEFTFPWGKIKSHPIAIDGNSYRYDITPKPFTNPKVKNAIIKVINEYSRQYVAAKAKRDANVFTTLDEKLKQEWARDFADQKEFISNEYYKGQAIKTVVATKGVTISKVDNSDAYKVKVPVQFHRQERTYHIDNDSGDEPLKEKINDTYVWMIYNTKTQKWEITDINSMFVSQGRFTDSQAITTNFQ